MFIVANRVPVGSNMVSTRLVIVGKPEDESVIKSGVPEIGALIVTEAAISADFVSTNISLISKIAIGLKRQVL